MLNKKVDRSIADRARATVRHQYEVAYFADKHGISQQSALSIILRAGPSRVRADELAKAERT